MNTNFWKWAKNEVKLAHKRDKEHIEEYGAVTVRYLNYCLKSALRAYKRLCKDNHTNRSLALTQLNLNRLIEGKTLSEIEDDEKGLWTMTHHKNGETEYQCNRMPSLFKYTYSNGIVRYRDLNRWRCVDADNGVIHRNCAVEFILEKLFPLKLPYVPVTNFVYCREYREDTNFVDTISILFIDSETCSHVALNKYFKKDGKEWVEIDKTEFEGRIKNRSLVSH